MSEANAERVESVSGSEHRRERKKERRERMMVPRLDGKRQSERAENGKHDETNEKLGKDKRR